MEGCVPRMRVCTGGKDDVLLLSGTVFLVWELVKLEAVVAAVACE